MRIGICSGYFALGVHEGHLDLLNAVLEDTKENDVYGMVVVIVNNDEQTKQKYGFVPISADERCRIIDKINSNFESWISKDKDTSVAKTIEGIEKWFKHEDPDQPNVIPDLTPKITFYNSGDRNPESANASELEVCARLGIAVEYLDMPKRGSSTSLLKKIGDHYKDNPHRLAYDGLDMTDEQKKALYLAQNDFRRGDYMTVPTFNLEFKRNPLERYLKPGDIGYQ